MREGAGRIIGAGRYGLDGRCQWPLLGGGRLVLQVEDGLEVFLTVAEALGMEAAERDAIYERLAGAAARAERAGPPPPGRVEHLAHLLYETRRRAAWLEYRLAEAAQLEGGG